MSSTANPAQRRAPLPEGTLPVGLSLLVAGVATFAFFRIGKNALGGDDEFQPIQSMWFATFALAPGFFLPLEQELGRALAHRRARERGWATRRRQGAAARHRHHRRRAARHGGASAR